MSWWCEVDVKACRYMWLFHQVRVSIFLITMRVSRRSPNSKRRDIYYLCLGDHLSIISFICALLKVRILSEFNIGNNLCLISMILWILMSPNSIKFLVGLNLVKLKMGVSWFELSRANGLLRRVIFSLWLRRSLGNCLIWLWDHLNRE